VLFEHHCLVQFYERHVIAEVCWTILWMHLYQGKCQETNSTFCVKLSLSNKLISRNTYDDKNIKMASKERKLKFCMKWWQFSHYIWKRSLGWEK
jgi:hypothetical protein